jgi:hypothetical protein
MEQKLKEIEEKLDSLIAKIDGIEDWINDFSEDFLWDFTDFNQTEMFSWFHLADSVERMESILFALNQKFNLNPEEIDFDLNKKIADLQVEKEKLKKEFDVVLKEKEDILKPKAEKSNELLIESQESEWENISQTISHTMKGPNNNIVNKIAEIINKKEIVIQEIQPILKIIQAEAKYSNDIINLFDIIRKGTEFRTESLCLSDIIEMIKYSERRCITLAWNNSSELSKLNLERIIGSELSGDSRSIPLNLLFIKNADKIYLHKSYRIHKTAFETVIDEFILNMFRHAKSRQNPNLPDYSHIAEKPEVFEVEFNQQTEQLQIIFRNTSREPIYKSWQRILNADKAISLTKKSFGLFLASLFSEKHSHFKNIVFYEIDVPPNEDLSEIILTLKEV